MATKNAQKRPAGSTRPGVGIESPAVPAQPVPAAAPTVSEELIRELAYSKWEQAGRPEGDSTRFWFEAEAALRSK